MASVPQRCNTCELNSLDKRRKKMRTLVILGSVLLLSACSAEPGSEKWCTAMKEKSKTEWTLEEGKTFASHCILDSRTIGSEEWCADLKGKPKGEWTADEAAGFAKHCVM